MSTDFEREDSQTSVDYTEIRDDRIRGKICNLMSDMLDSPDKNGIYPTSEFMWKMETFILGEKSYPARTEDKGGV